MYMANGLTRNCFRLVYPFACHYNQPRRSATRMTGKTPLPVVRRKLPRFIKMNHVLGRVDCQKMERRVST